MTRRTVFKGVIILAVSNILVKLIGVFYTIPLARLIGAEGMGLFSSAYQVYLWLFILSTTGLPIAISRLVSENISLSRYHEVHKTFKTALYLMLLIGILSTGALYIFSDSLVKIIGASKAYYSVIAIAPCLTFVAVMSAYRGYFQGMQDMVPTALSQILEAVIKVGVGLGMAYQLMRMGTKYSAAGAISGVTVGAFGGMLLLIIMYYIKKDREIKRFYYDKRDKLKTSSYKKIIINLIKIAFPITLGASVFSISSVIDLTMIIRRLKEIGYSEDYAIALYGYLTGYAFKIYSLPATIIIALAISLVPLISSLYIKKNILQTKKIIHISLKWSLLFSIPSAIGIGLLSEQILQILFNDTNASQMLKFLSLAIVFVTSVQVSSSILQGIGRELIPVKNLLIGAFLKVLVNYLLIGIPSINILGAPIGTIVCYLIVAILNLRDISKILKIRYSLSQMFIKPMISGIIMGASVFSSYNYAISQINNNIIATLTSVVIGFVVYSSVIILIGGLNREDIEVFPYKFAIFDSLIKLNLIKKS